MTTRILPPDEWPRLDGTYLEPLWRQLSPSRAMVFVVEKDGAIIGTWVLMTVLHVEGFSSQNAAVTLALLRAMKAEVDGQHVPTVITGADTTEMEGYLKRLDPHLMEIPGKQFTWTLPTL